MTTKFTILGGGVVGLCVANELLSRGGVTGSAITLIDPHGAPGPHGCSWWAGGMLAPDCEGESAEEPVVRLGREAAPWWASHGAEVMLNGSLVVALGRDQRELDRFARRTNHHVTLDRAALGKLEADLDGRFERGLFMPSEAHLNPRSALLALYGNLKSMGVKTVTNASLEGLVIDCRGLAATDELADLRGVKGEMVILKSRDLKLHRPVRLLHPRFPLYIVPRGDGIFMLGATQLENGDRTGASVRSIMELLNSAFALHPALGEAELVEIGVDARPAFHDNLPRIRRRNGRIYVNGLFRHGYLLSPALARMTADLIFEEKIPEVMDEDHG